MELAIHMIFSCGGLERLEWDCLRHLRVQWSVAVNANENKTEILLLTRPVNNFIRVNLLQRVIVFNKMFLNNKN